MTWLCTQCDIPIELGHRCQQCNTSQHYWVPTTDEIKQGCAFIQSQWTTSEELKRRSIKSRRVEVGEYLRFQRGRRVTKTVPKD